MNLRSLQSIDETTVSKILGDTNRLSELENFGVFNRSRLESIDQICATAQIAFAADFCVATLIDYADLYIVGRAGDIKKPEETLRLASVSAVCDLAGGGQFIPDEDCSKARDEKSKHTDDRSKLIVLPIETSTGCRLGAFCIGVPINRQFPENGLELASKFATSCLQQLETNRMQAIFAQRAEISRRQADKLKAQKKTLVHNEKMFVRVSQMARIVGWQLDTETKQLLWSGEFQTALGLSDSTIPDLHKLFRKLGPANLKQLRRRFQQCLKKGEPFELELNAKTSSGKTCWFRIAGEPDCSDHSTTKISGTLQDITIQKEKESVIQHVATHDELTGLANRKLFNSSLTDAMKSASHGNTNMAVVLIDADHFKQVNDTFGHTAGDQVLCEFAERIKSCFRSNDVVARLGGDEFGVILPKISDPNSLHGVCSRIQSRLALGIDHEGGHSLVSASIGIAIYPADSLELEDLLHRADVALYQSKDNGRACYTYFDQSMMVEADEKHQLINKVSAALASEEFVPYYQPVIESCSEKVASVEALVRWKTPSGEVLAPGSFWEALEDPGVAIRIGDFMIKSAIDQLRIWQDNGDPPRQIAVNLSTGELQAQSFADNLLSRLAAADVQPSGLVVEVTENVFLGRGNSSTKDNLQKLSDAGVTVALDDFGTGFASLTHLKEFPVDRIKIDRSFIMQLPDAECLAIVKAIIALGQNLGLEVVAEGIETPQQASILEGLGCDYQQGFFYAKPTSVEDLSEVINSIEYEWPGRLHAVGA